MNAGILYGQSLEFKNLIDLLQAKNPRSYRKLKYQYKRKTKLKPGNGYTNIPIIPWQNSGLKPKTSVYKTYVIKIITLLKRLIKKQGI